LNSSEFYLLIYLFIIKSRGTSFGASDFDGKLDIIDFFENYELAPTDLDTTESSTPPPPIL
jgi:hypothetical protein